MNSSKTLTRILGIAALATLGLSSCSNKATEEQMKTLRDLDQSRDQYKMDLERAKNNLRDVQGKLSAQDVDLADCQRVTAAVHAGLVNWPNIWADSADWRPAPPPPPPATEPTKKKRKH
jgi:outer membrane murein-binding lipoprotein Lpp